MAIGTQLAIALLPRIPRFFDGIRVCAAIHFGEIEQLAEATTFGTPTLRRIVTEHLGVERLERTAALRAGAFRGMNGDTSVVVESKQSPVAELQGLIDEQLGGFGGGAWFLFKHADDNLHVMFAKAVEAKLFGGGEDFAVGTDFRVAVFGGPFSDIRVKALAIFDHGCEQEQVAALFHLQLEARAELVAGLGFDGQLAIGAILRAKP